MQQLDLRGAEQLVQASVDRVNAIVGLGRRRIGRVGAGVGRGGRDHRLGDPAEHAGGHGAEQRGAAGRHLAGVGDADLHAADVGDQLHGQRAALGDPAAGDDLRQGDAVLGEVVDDPPVAEGDRLEQRPIDLLGGALQREPEDRAGQVGVGQDRAVAVEPIQRDQAGLAGPELRRAALEPLVGVSVATQGSDEPGEHVADRGLPRLVAVEPGQDPVASHPGDPGRRTSSASTTMSQIEVPITVTNVPGL